MIGYDLNYTAEEEEYLLYVLAVDFSTPPPLSGIIVSGDITSAVGGVKAADIEIEATEAQCDRTNTGFECVIESGAASPSLKVFNYYKATKTLFGCSDGLVVQVQGPTTTTENWTRFDLPLTSSTTAHIVIKETSC